MKKDYFRECLVEFWKKEKGFSQKYAEDGADFQIEQISKVAFVLDYFEWAEDQKRSVTKG